MRANKDCPSYDCGICVTYPTMHDVKCGSEETKTCKWLNFDFYGAKYCAEKQESEGKNAN